MKTRRLAMVLGITALFVATLNDHAALTTANVVSRHLSPTDTHTEHSLVGQPRSGLQTSNAQRSTTPQFKLSLVVDGKTAPAQVPDRIAYYHFIKSHAQPGVLNASELRRQEIRLGRLGLSKSDYAALSNALKGVKDQLALIEISGRVTSTNPFDVKQRRETVLDSVRQQFQTALSSDGAARLQAYIDESVKPNIKMFASP